MACWLFKFDQTIFTSAGISQHRNHKNLSNAIEHVLRMRKMDRINSFGLPDDFSKEDLFEILVRTGNNELDDVIHAVNQCLSEGKCCVRTVCGPEQSLCEHVFVSLQYEDLGKNEMTKITISNQSRKSNQRMGVHGPPNTSEVGSGAMEE
jgi:hypothetical protein